MARKQDQQQTVDSLVRSIVREEVASMFAMFSSFDEDETDQAQTASPQPTSLNASGSGSSTPGGGTKRRTKQGKGRATNPTTDKRFKANREANA